MTNIEINNKVKARLPLAPIRKLYSRYLKKFKLKPSSAVSLAFVNSAEMKQMNQKYRHQDKATDVLSFAEADAKPAPAGQAGFLGEIIICYPVAVSQAQSRRHSVMQEINILFAHGLVHLLGYDHGTDLQARRMEKLERQIRGKSAYDN